MGVCGVGRQPGRGDRAAAVAGLGFLSPSGPLCPCEGSVWAHGALQPLICLPALGLVAREAQKLFNPLGQRQ